MKRLSLVLLLAACATATTERPPLTIRYPESDPFALGAIIHRGGAKAGCTPLGDFDRKHQLECIDGSMPRACTTYQANCQGTSVRVDSSTSKVWARCSPESGEGETANNVCIALVHRLYVAGKQP